jgi:hypothetical protein
MIEHLLLEHRLVIFIDNVSFFIDQVSLRIHFSSLSVNLVSFFVFV